MDGREAFEMWVAPADPESNAYIDMGADEFFIAGYEYRQAEIDALKAEIIRLVMKYGKEINAEIQQEITHKLHNNL